MPGCAAIGCNNRSEKGYTMKCFPRNPNLRRIWKERVSRADWEPSNNSFLCHVHFDSDQWIPSQSRRLKLKKNAIPSIFTITSTRKSPRKRRKSINGQQEDFYYLDESSDPLPTVRNTICNSFSSRYIPAMIASKKSSEPSNGMRVTNGRTSVREVDDAITNSEARIKPEMKSQLECDQDLDDIERKLRLICDGETGNGDKIECANGRANSEKYCLEYSRQKDEPTSDRDVKDIREAIDRKKKSRYEIMKDIEKSVGFAKAGAGTSCSSDTSRRSTFTIKVTGLEEDVEDIVQGLTTERYEYKSSNESSRKSRGIVTSIISVMDDSSMKMPILKKPKLEIDESPPDDKRIDWNWQGNGNPTKLSMESPDEDEFSYKRLREKVKYQEELIRKLSERPAATTATTTKMTTSIGSKSCASNGTSLGSHDGETTGKRRIEDNSGIEPRESGDSLPNGLALRLNNAEETNKRLNKRLMENEKERKRLELQIRQRDNRIKELNWKLDKASKYVERAEKNAITYRKKMINMQSLMARRKVLPEYPRIDQVPRPVRQNCQNREDQEDRIARAAQPEESILDPEEIIVAEDRNTIGDVGHYRTVQDIFDESNDCDNDPYVIDTREDFIRQFKDAFEPRVSTSNELSKKIND